MIERVMSMSIELTRRREGRSSGDGDRNWNEDGFQNG